MDIYITLDYELFLGDSTGTPENCLIKPMEALLDLASEKCVLYTIFVDATYLIRLKQLMNNDSILEDHYKMVVNNIMKCVSNGHDVQLHIHPQWAYSYWDKEGHRWIMDKDHYKLSDLSLSEARDLLKKAKQELDSVVGYKTTAFRAGGFCLDNFSEYKDLFLELGLTIDSSVARNQYVKSNVHYYDYRHVPTKQIYKFSNSVKQENENGEFTEVTISSFSCASLYYYAVVRKASLKYSPTIIYKDGESISDGENRISYFAKKIFGRFRLLCTIDAVASCYLEEFYSHLNNQGYKEMIILGHPKNASDASIDNLRRFIEKHNNDRFVTSKGIINASR